MAKGIIILPVWTSPSQYTTERVSWELTNGIIIYNCVRKNGKFVPLRVFLKLSYDLIRPKLHLTLAKVLIIYLVPLKMPSKLA